MIFRHIHTSISLLLSISLYTHIFISSLFSHHPACPISPATQIMFGHAVTVFFKDVFAKHAALFKQLNVNANNGFGDVVAKIKTLPEEQRKADLVARCLVLAFLLFSMTRNESISGI